MTNSVWFEPWSEVNEYIAASLFWRWRENWNAHDLPHWDGVGGREKEKWRERAQLLMDALDVDLEYGVRSVDELDGTTYKGYIGKDTAEAVKTHIEKYNPAARPQVVVRLIGKWEDI